MLGSETLGLYQLFSQIMTYVALVDGGLSNAVLYSLYKPNANRDDKKINAYKEALPLLRTYKLIDYKASTINEGLPIRILPSIQVVVPQDKLEEINARLSAMKNMSDEGDDIDENADED